MKKSIYSVLIVALLIVAYYHNCHLIGFQLIRPKGIRTFYSEWSLQRSINFYGKVMDQHDQPVNLVQVQVSIRGLTRDKRKVIKTDEKGVFEIRNQTGKYLFIKKIEKNGYEYMREKGKTSFQYGAYLEKDIFKPDKNNPVVFHMRKKEPPTLVIPSKFGWKPDSAIEEEIDLIRGEMYTGNIQRNFGRLAHADMKVKTALSKDKTHFKLTMVTPDHDSGIILSDQLLYVPPETGYQPRVDLAVPVSGEVKKHIYVKSRGGRVYSRIDTEVRAGQEEISISMKSWSNPNGIRNVDYDLESYIKELRRRDEENKQRGKELEERHKKYLEKKKKKEEEGKSWLWKLFH